MTLRLLLDTHIVSEPMRERPDPRIMNRLRDVAGTAAIAAITWHELLYGYHHLADSRKRASLGEYLFHSIEGRIPVLPYDAAAAAWHASERARLAVIGLAPPFADGQIASIASVNGLTLVTNDRSAFSRLKGLRVERWHR